MTRLPATRTLTTALLGGLLALGSIAPAFAQQQDEQDRHERRDARRQQRDEDGQPKPQARNEGPRQQEARSRADAPRHEHWGDAAQQRDVQRRDAMDLQAQARQREGAAARDSAQRDAQRAREWQSRDAVPERIEARRAQDAEQARRRDDMGARVEEQRRRDAGERQALERREREQASASERAIREARAREEARDAVRDERRGDWQADRGDRHGARPGEPGRVDRDDQRRRYEQDRQRAHDWQRQEASRRAAYEQRSRELERQRRNAQYRYQQDYYRRWLAQQARWNNYRSDYYNDPYYYTPANIRYGYGGSWYYTNRYGANLLQQAVRDGYQEGFRAGRADSMDGWRFDYRGSYAWIDGSYGYGGYYVNRDTYRYYFRQGFERGYRDAYYGRYQYGYYDRRSDIGVILPAVIGAILGFSLH